MREQTGQELEEPRRTIKIRQRRAIGFGDGDEDGLQALPEAHGARARRSSSARPSSTTRSSSPTRWCWTSSTASAPNQVGWYIFAFAVGNFLGPLLLGRFFDSVGRKPMIAGTYILSGVLLAITAVLFNSGHAHRDDADRGVVRDLLLRLGGRELRVPDGVGDLPDGDARDGDLVLLRRRHGDRRHHRPAAVRAADRDRRRDERDVRLPARRGADDRGRRRRDRARRRGRRAGSSRTSPSRSPPRTPRRTTATGELDVGKLEGEDAAPIDGRFERETEKTGGEA